MRLVGKRERKNHQTERRRDVESILLRKDNEDSTARRSGMGYSDEQIFMLHLLNSLYEVDAVDNTERGFGEGSNVDTPISDM
jgi:hypothetical protein